MKTGAVVVFAFLLLGCVVRINAIVAGGNNMWEQGDTMKISEVSVTMNVLNSASRCSSLLYCSMNVGCGQPSFKTHFGCCGCIFRMFYFF